MFSKCVKIIVLIAILVAAIAPAPMFASAQAAQEISGLHPVDKINLQAQLVPAVDLTKAIRTKDGLVGVIVRLKDAPLATYSGSLPGLAATSPKTVGTGKLDVNSPASKAYMAYLDQVQQKFTADLASVAPSAKVERTYKVALNGLSMKVAEKDVKALMKMSGVAQVYPDEIQTVHMDASLDLIGAPALWTALGGRDTAGKGIKVADVDSGLRFANPMFANPAPTSGTTFAMPFGFPRGECVGAAPDAAVMCNGKVIAARHFLDPALPLNTLEVDSALDINGHGSHTAGTAVGDRTTIKVGATVPVDTEISGVAPGAYLMVYKALFTTPDGTSASGTDGMLSAALEAALMDGADVINNSWGGGAGGDPNATIYKAIIDAITEAGTVVVFSAGNSGPGSSTIGCPGCVESAITVAASTTSRIFANTVSVTAPAPVPANLANMAGMQGSGPKLAADLTGTIKYVATDPLGCDPFPADAFKGMLALVSRGTCNFAVKVGNATAAGAVAVVVANNAGGPPIAMGSLETTTIPSVMVDQTSGSALVAFVQANANATVQIKAAEARFTNPDWADIMASFSSVGPNGDKTFLKPDITAPGVNILSSFSGALANLADPQFAFEQGTSMAAPHVTGAVALIRQFNPNLTPAEIKTLLTSTANQSLRMPDAKTPAGPFNMGAGRLDLANAMKSGAVFSAPSFSSATCVLTCDWKNTIKNIGTKETTWTASVAGSAGLNVTVSPATFKLGAGLSGEFTVTADASNLPLNKWYNATITWKDASKTYPDVHLPIVVMPVSSSNPLVFTKTVDKATAKPGDTLTYTLNVTNFLPQDTTFSLRDFLPAGLKYVAGSVSKGGTFDPATNQVQSTIKLAAPTAELVSAKVTGYMDLSALATPDNSLDLKAFCAPDCDDQAINISGMDFKYFGATYNKVGLVTNGFAQPGGATSATSQPQILPDPANPNNIFAPMWTDLDVYPTWASLDVQNAAKWFLIGVADNTGQTYTVVQWTDVPLFQDATKLFSFQLWFADGTDAVWFTYGKLPTDWSNINAEVGIEDATGLSGQTYFYTDHGTNINVPPDPASKTPDLGIMTNVESAQVTFQAQATDKFTYNQKITNVAELVKDVDPVVDRAFAQTRLVQGYSILLPLVRK